MTVGLSFRVGTILFISWLASRYYSVRRASLDELRVYTDCAYNCYSGTMHYSALVTKYNDGLRVVCTSSACILQVRLRTDIDGQLDTV